MCGICGVISFDSKLPVERRWLEAMSQQIVHRGPDDAGFYLSVWERRSGDPKIEHYRFAYRTTTDQQ